MKKLFFGLMALLLASLGGNGAFASDSHGWVAPVSTMSTQPVSQFRPKAAPIGHLEIREYDRYGVPKAYRSYYGTVTNIGTDSMANDNGWWVTSNVPNNTLFTEKDCQTGTGATAAAATDIALQTPDSVTPVAGTQTYSLLPNGANYKLVCTLAYSGTEAVTEWGLLNSTTASTSFTTSAVGTNNTAVFAAATFTASSTTVQGEQQFTADDTTNPCYGFITSNSTTTLTVGNLGSGTDQWYNTGATTTCNTSGHTFPQSGDTVKVLAELFDHQVFAALNVINGDSIQFTFTLSLPSGS